MAVRRGPTPQRIKAEDVECYQFLASADETPARTGVGKDTGFHGIWYHRNVVKHAGVIADRCEEEPRRTRVGGVQHSVLQTTLPHLLETGPRTTPGP